ncbi:MAG TPA: response regulator [Acidiferrobacteraceae bacterium]|nr:response regulator [Acidiferrobacteraceae bacterium]
MSKNLNILVVEDDNSIAFAVQHILAKKFSPCDVSVAHDGREAWGLIKENSFDVVISDWNMPHKRGDELLEDLRTHETKNETPFLMLTARSDKDSVRSAAEAEVTDYLIKPFSMATLVTKVEQLLAPSQ